MVRAIFTRREEPHGGAGALLLAALAYAAATVTLSWPLSADPGRVFADPAKAGDASGVWTATDRDLVAWILAWVAHALRDSPRTLFEANIFHPAPHVLASSENLLGVAPIAAPLFWATGNAVLVHNATILAVVWLTALTTFVLVRAWSGSSAAGFLAGVGLGFSPYVVGYWSRLHWSAIGLFPIVLLLARRVAREPRPTTLLALVVATALQLLAGAYIAYELAVTIAVFVPALFVEARPRRPWAAIGALFAGGLALVPIATIYLGTSAASLPVADSVARLRQIEAPIATLARDVLANVTWPVLLLAIAGLFSLRRGDRHVRFTLALLAVVGFVLALGPRPLLPGTSLPGPYRIAMEIVPGFAMLRGPARFLVLTYLGVFVLAGLACGDLFARARLVAGGFLVAGASALLFARLPAPPIPVAEAIEPSREAIAAFLRERDGGAVVEVPIAGSAMEFATLRATGRTMLASTLHWHPLVNGYSGHPPASARLLTALVKQLPEPHAFEDLCALTELRFLVVNLRDLSWLSAPWRNVRRVLPVKLVRSFGDTRVFEVERDCGALVEALRAELEAGSADVTLRGTPLAPLSAEARRGRIESELPSVFLAGLFQWVPLRVTNAGATRWPGLTSSRNGAVALAVRWREKGGTAWIAQDPPMPLARDLGPGDSMAAWVGTLPPRPGLYEMEIGLVQEGPDGPEWFGDEPGGEGGLLLEVETAGAAAGSTGKLPEPARSSPTEAPVRPPVRSPRPHAGRRRRNRMVAPPGP